MLTQEEKLALRLKQVLSEPGLHKIMVFVTPDEKISFWLIEKAEVEGLQKMVKSERKDNYVIRAS